MGVLIWLFIVLYKMSLVLLCSGEVSKIGHQVIQKLMLSKNDNMQQKMGSKIRILQWKKIREIQMIFDYRKLILKVRYWHFLTPPHYTNFKNSVISFDCSCFLTKSLSNFVSLPRKLHGRYCHSVVPSLLEYVELRIEPVVYDIDDWW